MTGTGGRPGGKRPAGRGRPWLVNVASLRQRPGSSEPVAVSAAIDDLSVSAAWVPGGAKVGLEGRLEAASGGVLVVGVVRAPWEGTCRRCLRTARGQLEVHVRELATNDPDPDLGYPLGVDRLDLEPIVHDACILELPLAPLCEDECRGLCPTCGANLNEETCSCERAVAPRWAALAGLAGSPSEDQLQGSEETDETASRQDDQPG